MRHSLPQLLAGGHAPLLRTFALLRPHQVLDEIGVDIAAGLQSAPNKRIAQAASTSATATKEMEDDEAELASRLANLKA
jgi:hypothetical protein